VVAKKKSSKANESCPRKINYVGGMG